MIGIETKTDRRTSGEAETRIGIRNRETDCQVFGKRIRQLVGSECVSFLPATGSKKIKRFSEISPADIFCFRLPGLKVQPEQHCRQPEQPNEDDAAARLRA